MANKAIFAFSADPITFGHIDIISRAAQVFDQLVVAIGVNSQKQYLLSLEERLRIARFVLAKYDNVTVMHFSGLLVDLAIELEADVIVKGVRNSNDFDYEHTLHRLAQSQVEGIDTHLLFANQSLSHISSSAVKAVQFEQGFIHDFVPLFVKNKLELVMSNLQIVGLYADTNMQSTRLAKELEQYGKTCSMSVIHVNLDGLFTDNSLDPENLDGKKLKIKVYAKMIHKLRQKIYGKSGLLVLESKLLLEPEIFKLCNNTIILIGSEEFRLNSRVKVTGLIKESDYGKIWEFDSGYLNTNIEYLFDSLVEPLLKISA